MENQISEVKDLSEDDIKDFEDAVEAEDTQEETPDEPTEETIEEPVVEDKPTEIPEKEASTVELREVRGETPREYALRAEVNRLRNEKRKQELGETIPPVVEERDTDEQLRELGYDDDQIIGLKKVVDIIATKQGYIKKENTYKDMVDETLNSFVEEHPEYAVENDKDDLYWGRFREILGSDYNIAGKSSKQIKSIFDKVDRDVKDALGDKDLPEDKIEAQKRKIGDISHGTSASSTKINDAKKVMPAGNKIFVASSHPNLVFKDFDEDEVEEFTK
jgi:hypothetical protein